MVSEAAEALSKDKKGKALYPDVFKPEADSQIDMAMDSDDSINEQSSQEVVTSLHPLLRSGKLTKRLRKDRNLTPVNRRKLQIRRNNINFRIRKDIQNSDKALLNKVIPLAQ